MLWTLSSVELVLTKAPREGASFIISQSELGGYRGGGCRGVGVVRVGGFFPLSPSWSWTKPRCQRGLFWARFPSFWVSGFFGRPKEKQASSDAADAGLGVSSDAADAGLGVSASHVAT